ncbi:MAG TPA: hypothetical protein DD381_00215 [Lentisphaeria bacterium]|nr:MAG: hypothetical protein A2X47_05570 [Lentisphaerae bacterium GWF2_38_69]HBM14765.1 hypothetical protein [Lentisphaeria bacterium]
MIRIDDLKQGYLYLIDARNSHLGIWMSKKNSFLISRFKFGDNFLFEEDHWDTGEPYGTVKPIKELEKTPFEADRFLYPYVPDKNRDLLNYLNLMADKYPLDEK